jgi:PEP-CTERM motif-containing protein
MNGILRVFALVPVILAVTVVNAKADFITAYGWVSTEGIVTTPGPGGSPVSLALGTCSHGTSTCTTSNADVTFTTSGIDFNKTGGDIADWVATSMFPLNNLVDKSPNSPMDPTIWEFVGNISATSPLSFTIVHDDGVTFIVNGQTVISVPLSSATSLGTYTGAPGNVPFDLVYANCCGGAAGTATLQVRPLAAPTAAVPEPSSIVLFGTGIALIGLLAVRRRFWRYLDSQVN